MERVLSVYQMQQADKFTIEKLGICQEELIKRAGEAVANVIKEHYFGGRVLVCVGKGNNGKDGLEVADILSKTHGFTVSIFNAETCFYKLFDKDYDLVVDCLFGTGLNKVVEGKYAEIINKINSLSAVKIACDIPSGINGDTGEVMGVAVKADMTIAIQEYKFGHFFGDGIDYCGQVVCKDIGISVWDEDIVKRVSENEAKTLFEKRKRNVNKGSFGKTCIIGGSQDFSGSVILSSNAVSALKSGVGYSYLVVPKTLYNAYVGKMPECILIALDTNTDKVDEENLNKVLHCDTIAVGMGMTATMNTYNLIEYLLKNYNGTLIIDADGLNVLSKFGKECLKNKTCKVVLTPHLGEFSRLLGKEKAEIKQNLVGLSKQFAKEYNVISAVKSAVSLITDGEETYINTAGCSGMAKAGSGDALSGLIAGVLARSNVSVESVAGVLYVFGKAGEFAEKDGCEFTITATEIIGQFANVIKRLN